MAIKSKALILAFCLILSMGFSAYGPAHYKIEKTWHFGQNGIGNIGEIKFSGFFLANNSQQKITIVDSTPEMIFQQDSDGLVHVYYNGTMDKVGNLFAIADVVVYYDDPKLVQDPSFTIKQLNSTELTEATPEMVEKAKSLTNTESMLSTMVLLTDFTYHHLTYEDRYLGKLIPASEVYNEKQGVCAEYSHLFIALAQSVGLETKYMVGYSIGNDSEYQDHAWVAVNVPGHGWLQIDPTYNQIGKLDNSHVLAISGRDNMDTWEYATFNGDVDWNSEIKVTVLAYDELETQPIIGNCAFSASDYTVAVNMTNPSDYYQIFPYRFAIKNGFGDDNTTIKLLKPNEKTEVKNQVYRGAFEPNKLYYLPIWTKIYGNDICKGFALSIDTTETIPDAMPTDNENNCFGSLILLPLIYLGIFRKTYGI